MSDRVGLLVSVRSAEEAEIAATAGVDWIDIKEPRHGPLGAASGETISEIFETVAGRVPLSIALGELIDWNVQQLALPHSLAATLLVKFGLAGCASTPDWPAMWRTATDKLPINSELVGVVYADRRAAKSPSPQEVLAAAVDLRARAVLVDTHQKDGRSLFAHWSLKETQGFVRAIQDAGMMAVLAGSLHGEDIARAIECSPDLIGVRGAVCDGDRTAKICPKKLNAVVENFRSEGAEKRIGQAQSVVSRYLT